MQPSSVSLLMVDRIDGPFEVELAWIGVWNDKTHQERMAYEVYKQPRLNF